ncbi:MAG: class I SAM-dependent methyltransferase [Porphyromonadaceae bacterium]|nr:class I SAM-dependent methyltransferase [Porphyromonadaceae bacterium]
MNKIVDNWNNRYSSDEYAYGELPNHYLQENLKKLPAGKILFPGEGEGRNAVYAARMGWEVWAYDISPVGKMKAEKLAAKNNVQIDYSVGEIQHLDYQKEQFDAVALIYLHLAKDERSLLYDSIYHVLRPGGIVIAELFSKNHIEYQKKNRNVGGPGNIDFLYSIPDIQNDFNKYSILELKEVEIELQEGNYHNGTASVIRFIGRKDFVVPTPGV